MIYADNLNTTRGDHKSIADIREANNNFLDNLSGNDPVRVKEAADAASLVTKLRLRERAYLPKIIPPESVTNDMLTRAVETIQPMIVVDLECDVPGSTTIPFNHNGAMEVLMQNSRYPVYINRLQSPTMHKDVGELRTSTLDIRQIFMDAIVKNLSAFMDYRFMEVNNAILGPQDTYIPFAQNTLFRSMPGTITREAIVDVLNIVPKNGVVFGLETSTLLINQVTAKTFMKYGREETGGDHSQDVFLNGLSEINLFGKTWIVTIKRDLVPDGRIYCYTDPDYIGKNYVLTDTTVTVKQEKFFIQFDCIMEQGATIGNILGLGAAQFTNM